MMDLRPVFRVAQSNFLRSDLNAYLQDVPESSFCKRLELRAKKKRILLWLPRCAGLNAADGV